MYFICSLFNRAIIRIINISGSRQEAHRLAFRSHGSWDARVCVYDLRRPDLEHVLDLDGVSTD